MNEWEAVDRELFIYIFPLQHFLFFDFTCLLRFLYYHRFRAEQLQSFLSTPVVVSLLICICTCHRLKVPKVALFYLRMTNANNCLVDIPDMGGLLIVFIIDESTVFVPTISSNVPIHRCRRFIFTWIRKCVFEKALKLFDQHLTIPFLYNWSFSDRECGSQLSGFYVAAVWWSKKSQHLKAWAWWFAWANFHRFCAKKTEFLEAEYISRYL